MPAERPRDEAVAHRAHDSVKPSAADVRAELERILASRCFQQAGRASHFLRFVVEHTLADSGQRLKGYTIGVEVFGRPADFDAQSDALVRVEAGRLRRRLVEYYAGEGAANPVRIDLPRGSYSVEYHFVAAAASPLAADRSPAAAATPAPPASHWARVSAVLAVLLVFALGVIAWQVVALRDAERALDASGEPPRTAWPRIVVVPFENLGADGSLDTLAAAITEEVMLRLDELDLFVIASQASWYGASHEKSLDVAAAGGYLLTGSVRGTTEAARITVRLIEASSGAQLWAAGYDQPLSIESLPALQERVARDVTAIAAPYGAIFEAELARARRSVHSPTLRDCLATYHEYRRRVQAEIRDAALSCYENVTQRQPDAAEAWSGLALLHVDDYASSFGRSGEQALEAARLAAEKALAIHRDDFHASLALARVQFFAGEPGYRQTIDRMLTLRPHSAQALVQSAFLHVITGDSEQGLKLAQQALEQAKRLPGLYQLTLAAAYLREGRSADALAAAQKGPSQNWALTEAVIAAAAAHAGRPDVAANAAVRLRRLYPNFEAEALATFKRWRFDAALHDALVTGLEAAGFRFSLPEPAPSGG